MCTLLVRQQRLDNAPIGRELLAFVFGLFAIVTRLVFELCWDLLFFEIPREYRLGLGLELG